MWEPIPLIVPADAWTHPPRCPRGCVNPSPPVILANAGTHPLDVDSDATGVRYSRVEPAPVKTDAGTYPARCPRGCGDLSRSLSSRMRGPIPLVVLADAWTHPTGCPRGCVDPSHPLSLRMRGPIPTRYFREESAPVKTDARIHPHPPTRQSRARLTPLPLLSSWQAHDGDGASSADRSPCPPGCWTTDRRRTPGPPRAARPPSARARRRGCSGRP